MWEDGGREPSSYPILSAYPLAAATCISIPMLFIACAIGADACHRIQDGACADMIRIWQILSYIERFTSIAVIETGGSMNPTTAYEHLDEKPEL